MEKHRDGKGGSQKKRDTMIAAGTKKIRGRDIQRDRVVGKQRTRGTYKQMF